MRTSPRSSAATRRGIMLVDCLVYISLLALILGLAFSAFYRTLEHSTRLERNAADIIRALHVGERWRADVRSATGELRVSDDTNGVALHIPRGQGGIAYIFREGVVHREEVPGGRHEVVLPNVKLSGFFRDSRRHVAGWRWELELQGKQEVSRVKPMFSFLAVAPQEVRP